MYIYFENLSVLDLIKIKYKQDLDSKSSDSDYYFYFDIKRPASYMLNSFLFAGYNFKKLEFDMMQIRAKNHELQRLRIYREDLAIFNQKLRESESIRFYSQRNLVPNRLENYVLRGAIDGEILIKGTVNRSLYIIQVVAWHMSINKISEVSLFIEDRTWISILQEFSIKENIKLFASKNIFSTIFNRLKIFFSARNYPRLYFLLKNLRYYSFEAEEIKKDLQTIFVEGRGDIHFENDGNNSDFFWEMNSEFKKDRILYHARTKDHRRLLSDYGIRSISGKASFSDTFDSSLNIVRKPISIGKNELNEVNYLINTYKSNYFYWRSLFKKYNTKVYFSWYKFDKSHMAIADAINSVGGISVLWQIALNAIQETMCKSDADILFSYSNHCAQIDRTIDSNFKFNVITGYPKDYAIKASIKNSVELRKRLQLNGAKNIVSVLDENSLPDSRWHTGNELQRENYKYILENLFKHNDMGVIFKPKRYIDLKERLGDEVWSLLRKGINTGRCFIFDETKGFTTLATPIVASLASDLCIHSHLCAGSAGLESALAGTPTILIDREKTPASILNTLKNGTVVFDSWPEAIDAINHYFLSKDKDKEFGNWSSIIDELDPFRDGKGALRMGSFLESLFKGFERGLSRDDVMNLAAQEYADKWGSDKIVLK